MQSSETALELKEKVCLQGPGTPFRVRDLAPGHQHHARILVWVLEKRLCSHQFRSWPKSVNDALNTLFIDLVLFLYSFINRRLRFPARSKGNGRRVRAQFHRRTESATHVTEARAWCKRLSIANYMSGLKMNLGLLPVVLTAKEIVAQTRLSTDRSKC